MRSILLLLAMMLAGCATTATPQPEDLFLTRLQALCGKAFEGRIASPQVAADANFAGKRLVMHVRQCSAETIRIPFHVGEDRSRTWVLTRTTNGLRLKHDHRHEDGSEDRLTQYGGDSAEGGTAQRHTFPSDQFTKELLVREGNTAGVNNIWALEVHPGQLFAYELRRPGRFFRVEFDLTRPIAAPPPAWGTQ